MNLSYFNDQMKYMGFVLFDSYLDNFFINKLRTDLDKWIEIAQKIRNKNNIKGMLGVAHNILGRDDSMADFIKSLPLHIYLKEYFSGPYVLNSFSGIVNSTNSKGSYQHVESFHRDVRVYSKEKNLMINMLVMIDEFKIENGATRLLPSSHNYEELPCEEYISKKSEYIIGKSGSILLFDSNVFHSASKNLNGDPRRALTLSFTKPFMKPQFDFFSVLGHDFSQNKDVMDIIGLRSRIPSTLNEWYQEGDKRFYHKDQK